MDLPAPPGADTVSGTPNREDPVTPLPFISALLLSHAAWSMDYLPTWSYDGFNDGQSMVGREGWVGGYSPDRWLGWEGDTGRWVYPTSDDSDSRGWGEGGARDN